MQKNHTQRLHYIEFWVVKFSQCYTEHKEKQDLHFRGSPMCLANIRALYTLLLLFSWVSFTLFGIVHFLKFFTFDFDRNFFPSFVFQLALRTRKVNFFLGLYHMRCLSAIWSHTWHIIHRWGWLVFQFLSAVCVSNNVIKANLYTIDECGTKSKPPMNWTIEQIRWETNAAPTPEKTTTTTTKLLLNWFLNL